LKEPRQAERNVGVYIKEEPKKRQEVGGVKLQRGVRRAKKRRVGDPERFSSS
jgi:hypothetical protein